MQLSMEVAIYAVLAFGKSPLPLKDNFILILQCSSMST